jgi:transposase
MNNENSFDTSRMKLIEPCREQMEMQFNYLDMLLPPEHLARSVWEFVEAMDTRPCFAYVNTFVGFDGRSTTNPKILLAVWIYSILDGNSSARKLEILCKNHNAYKWIVGGAPINRTMLADFRSKDSMKFEDLLTNCLAVMVKAGLIKDEDFSQDGTRVKANAGFKSFRREESLQKLKEEIKLYIKELVNEVPESAYEKREKEKKIRIKTERLKRIEEALNNLEKERIIKKENGDKNHNSPSEEDLKNVRASTTDPYVRKMKMGDSGFRLAYNVQFATGMDSRVIFGVDVVTTLDPGTAPIMLAKVHSRLAKLKMSAPKNWVGDAAYSGKEDVNVIAEIFPNCSYYAPPQVCKGVDPKKHRRTDTEAIKKWRDMIDTDETKEIYKKRCSTVEFSNAQVKNCGLRQFLVRGISKVKGMALLHAIAQNISRYFDLINKKDELATV